MARIDELRLMTRVARLYYEQGEGQSQIARRLFLSQATVSRLLKRAEHERIVRITVSQPHGVFSDLEEALASRYGLQNAIVTDTINDEDEESIQRDIGSAAAYYLETTVEPDECIGISSWSGTLLAMVNAMHQVPRGGSRKVIQILGGASEQQARVHAAYLTSHLAELVHGEAIFLPAPGIVGSAETQQILLRDPAIGSVFERFAEVSLALVGIGTVAPSPLLASSGNIFSVEELDMLRRHGAAGDILNRFFDAAGHPVQTPLAGRVIGMSLEQLRQVKRAVGVAGGKRKVDAIRGALAGGLIGVLITDRFTALRLLDEKPAE